MSDTITSKDSATKTAMVYVCSGEHNEIFTFLCVMDNI